MISMPDTISDKHAMMLSLQNTNATNVTMPGSWWGDRLTSSTKIPFRVLKGI